MTTTDEQHNEQRRLRAEQVADALQGTAKSLESEAIEAECDDLEFLREIDDRVFLCETCGWWCELSELSRKSEDNEQHQLVCDDCEPSEDDE